MKYTINDAIMQPFTLVRGQADDPNNYNIKPNSILLKDVKHGDRLASSTQSMTNNFLENRFRVRKDTVYMRFIINLATWQKHDILCKQPILVELLPFSWYVGKTKAYFVFKIEKILINAE